MKILRSSLNVARTRDKSTHATCICFTSTYTKGYTYIRVAYTSIGVMMELPLLQYYL